IDRADCAIRSKRIDHVLDDAAVIEKSIAPKLQVWIAYSQYRGEGIFPNDIAIGNRLHRDIRRGGYWRDPRAWYKHNDAEKAWDFASTPGDFLLHWPLHKMPPG